ncbi:NAD(P)-dependent alcohol dehydrogenase [Gracilibacillus sp. YIM 98692]|uniref:NAD(P)-dependent alcohol dehydrogenase n=1 Tax=Gracilibacillus sp. YIM 98692 TaxID=2663532 RepID=UPI0013D749FD|nr:NAD(P)-dependent alcohol dehydrogenase [Gracilibacillus sp. YIM 98692]
MSVNTMKAAVLDKPLDMNVKDVPEPEIKEDEVLIKVYCIGICGSDVHYYEHGKIGRYEVKEPLILGHEMAGEVVTVGKKVNNLHKGDRVAVEPGVTCGRCEYCKEGRYNLCPDVVFMATPPVDGAWAEYVAVRSDFVFPLPDEMSYETGALLEPFSVGMHAMNRGKIKPSDRLLITGLGPIGLLAIQSAQLYGVKEIYATDVVPYRLELAKKLGVTEAINPAEESLSERLNTLTNDKGITASIETSGNSQAVNDVLTVTKRGGRIVLVGLPAVPEVGIDVTHVVDSEYDVYGLFRYVNTYDPAIQGLKDQQIDIEQVITDRFSLDQIGRAVEKASNEKDTSIKIMIYPNGE